mgnify:FL=1|tara:strand:+ start:743 stop:1408 length:666 start_codon:yes stop_codon:yes gene_type:complete
MIDLTLIIPAKNESESLPIVLENLKNISSNVIVSLPKDDLSTINSIKKYNVQIIKQEENGYGSALIEGIKNCKTKYFCIFNADGSFDSDDLYKMYDLVKSNDFVYASRYLQNGGSEDDTLITLFGNKIFSLMCKILFSLKINDVLYTYVMGVAESFNNLNIISKDFRFCVELPIKMQRKKYSYSSLPSYEKKRIAGNKKVNNFKDGFLILCEIIKLFFLKK